MITQNQAQIFMLEGGGNARLDLGECLDNRESGSLFLDPTDQSLFRANKVAAEAQGKYL